MTGVESGTDEVALMRVGARDEFKEATSRPFDDARRLGAQLVALYVFMLFAALVMGMKGAVEWETWTDVVLLAVGVIGIVWSWRRRRREGQEWNVVVIAFVGGSFAQALISLHMVGWENGPLPSAADIGLLAFTCGLIVYLVRRILPSGRSNAVVHILEAALMALSCAFI
ncbi:MAG: hypothetical protein WCI22_09775, partial [Actinomycetota bacterium]